MFINCINIILTKILHALVRDRNKKDPLYSLSSKGRVSWTTTTWQAPKIHTLRHSIAVPGWCWKAIFAHIIRLGPLPRVLFFFNKFPRWLTHGRTTAITTNNWFSARFPATRAAQINVRSVRETCPPLTNVRATKLLHFLSIPRSKREQMINNDRSDLKLNCLDSHARYVTTRHIKE